MNIKLFSIFVVFVSAVLAQNDPKCGIKGPKVDQSQSRIINGKVATPGEFPWTASFQSSIKGSSFVHDCDASIINKDWLLTSGRCKAIDETVKIKIVAGK